MTESDLIDTLIDRLNDGVEGVIFDRDRLETNRPEDWAAVELTGEEDAMWADGVPVAQATGTDVWVCVRESGTRVRSEVQAVLTEFCVEHGGGYRQTRRQYIYEIDRVLWCWHVSLVCEAKPEPDGETGGGG